MSKPPPTTEAASPVAPPTSTYAEVVYQRLRDEIFAGKLGPGTRLAEVDLARRMGVSQGPVREALARLRTEGLVVGRAHRGSFVGEVSMEDLRDVYAVREILERHALRLALPRMGDAEYAVLEGHIGQMRAAALAGDTAARFASDMQFHRRIYEWSGSAILLQFWEVIEGKTRQFAIYWTPLVFRSDPDWPVRHHHDLIAAMKGGYGPELEEELARHLAGIWASIEWDPVEGQTGAE